MLHIANPLYDAAFKYLMEDERIAKTILAALIKREIVSIEMRPNEYSNTTKDKIAMFRIDFAARVRDADGGEKLILIELQKTGVETETLRFRQYLGAQYSNPANMVSEDKLRFAYPIITIYVMGHRVGDIDVPVLYVGRKYSDYYGNEVTNGIPDPFVDSLTHESIVVQVPLLRGQINNRVEKFLDIFCQDRKDKDNPQLLNINESMMEDEEMRPIIIRLASAASDADVRRGMSIEEEILTALENRDTEIMKYKREAFDAKKEASDAKKEAYDAKKEAYDAKKEAYDAKKEAYDAKKEASDAKKEASDAKKEASDAKKEASDAKKEASDAKRAVEEQTEKINKQSELLNKQSEQLASAISALLSTGMDGKAVASALGITEKEYRRLSSRIE